MVLLLPLGSERHRVLPVEMDSHPDHMGQGTGQRQHSPSGGNRHLMMPPYSSLPPQHHYQGADIPSTNKPSPVPVTTASLFPLDSASSSHSSFTLFFCLLFPFMPSRTVAGLTLESRAISRRERRRTSPDVTYGNEWRILSRLTYWQRRIHLVEQRPLVL